MEAKEKAEELVNRFKIFADGGVQTSAEVRNAKQCALIAIDEILQTNPTIKGNSDDLVTMIVQTKAYWYRVQDEIEKL